MIHHFGGLVPSSDTIYRDQRRVREAALDGLEKVNNALALKLFSANRPSGPLRDGELIELDIDTTVLERYGAQEDVACGYSPRKRGRPSHHPIACRMGDSRALFGVRLRAGNEGLGELDDGIIVAWITSIREAFPKAQVLVRIDSGGESAGLLRAIEEAGALFLVKLRMTPDVLGVLALTRRWTVVDKGASGEAIRRATDLKFRRKTWPRRGWRAVAVRDQRDTGRQCMPWENSDDTARAYLTNAPQMFTADELARLYDKRAGIEPIFADLKGSWQMGACLHDFRATEAWLLLKLIAHNALQLFAAATCPAIRSWRTPALRSVLLQIPGRMVHSGRQWTLRLQRRPHLQPLPS